MMALADNAAWLVILAHIGPQLLAVTTSLHIDFLRKPDVCRSRGAAPECSNSVAASPWSKSRSPPRGSSDLVAKAQVTYSIPPRTTP